MFSFTNLFSKSFFRRLLFCQVTYVSSTYFKFNSDTYCHIHLNTSNSLFVVVNGKRVSKNNRYTLKLSDPSNQVDIKIFGFFNKCQLLLKPKAKVPKFELSKHGPGDSFRAMLNNIQNSPQRYLYSPKESYVKRKLLMTFKSRNESLSSKKKWINSIPNNRLTNLEINQNHGKIRI